MEFDKLQRTESLLRLVESAAFIGVWTLDLRSDELEWSDQLAAIHETLHEALRNRAPRSCF